jgi:hypothetical protein
MKKFLRIRSLLSATFSLFVALTVGINSYAQCVAPTANNVTVNCGQTATLTASTPGGLVQWYDAAANGNLLQTGNSFTTPALTTNTSYWVQNQYVSVGGNQSVTFNYNGGMQQWTVPAGVNSITVDARGAQGGSYSFGTGGRGGKAVATIPVVPGQTIYVFVGQSPGYGGYNTAYNGGGYGYYYYSSYHRGLAGGGASDVRIGGTALSDRKVVAGGGGGAGPYYYGYCYSNHGGHGGTTTGGNGNRCGYFSSSYCGRGGSQVAGGQGASGYPSGTLGNGGGNGWRGGGGGGGYYGGGAGYRGGGGGGGSNYAIQQATNVAHSQGVQNGHGQVIITYQSINVNCTSARTQVNVTVTLPAAPTANAAVVNCGATAALTASGGTGTYAWFSNAAGTTQVGTGANFTTPQLTANTTYYVGSTSAGGGGAAGTVYTFTNCNATGRYGPTQAQVNSAYSNTNLSGLVTSQSGVQLWTVPSSGTYRIEAFGAQGGGGNQFGRGAQIRGDFSLTAGQQLKIIVGQQGGLYGSGSGSGGGGSFVATSANVPLIVAGGGGGQYNSSSSLYNAHAVTVNGGQPTGCTSGGAGGNGGNGCNSSGAAGGGGFTGNGGNGTYGTGGASFTNGGNGGNHGSNAICVGGFGGGGGTHGNTGGGGGGGGYSGGAGGFHNSSTGSGGGGGSYNNGTNQVNTGGVRTGHGLVTITSMSSSCVSAVVPVAITVNPPTTPTANNVTINCGNTATLTASNGTGTYVWYSDAAGTQQVATGASFTTPALVSGATYYVGTTAGQAGCNANSLANILSALNSNQGAISATVPSGYNFNMDGPNGANGTYISDGGNDMYDGGNYISTNFQNNIQYSDGNITNSNAFGAGSSYFTKKINSMWVLAADMVNVSAFNITGNNGADGGGSLNGTIFNVTVGCQTYKVLLKRVYNAGNDPSINQMVIIPNNANANHSWPGSTDNTQHNITGLSGTSRLYYLLYARSSGGYVDDVTAQNIATTFLTQVSATTAAQALCQSNLAPVQITVNSNIAQPVVSGATTINCGATTTLTSSSGNNTAWYTAAAGGNLLGTGSTYTTTSLAAGTTIYATQATINQGSQTFNYTGSQQSWTVPAGVTSINVDVQGAQGGQTSYGTAGRGGRTQATIPVTPGSTLYINVGGQGNYSTGGWNGGGSPYGCNCVGGGGGASDIRIGGNALANRAIVAGGGGGGGYYWNWNNDHGGHGGGLIGEAGKTNNGYNPTYCGQGGTQAAGGAGATIGGAAGSLGNGGGSSYYAGSGGGGYYGGGAGRSGGGGGGGSSFTNNQATGVTHTQGYKTGNGLITISWNSIGCASSPVAVPITVNALAAPTANNAVIGCGTTAALTASGGGGNSYTWYANANGTGQVATGANYTSPALSANTTYYVAANSGLAAGTAFNFSNASATGRTGPTQAQVNAAYSGTNLAGNVTVNTQGIQEWIVPQTGMYRIQANGAQGGGNGGLGARMQGDFSLTQGQKLFIVVGQQGLGPVNSGACGGGGGSFVAVGSASYTTSTALIVAGGGGGASPQQGQPGLITTNGGQGENCQAGGTNGNGGQSAQSCGNGTGGGGGFLTDGQSTGSYGNQRGYGFLSGAALGGTSQSGAREGGFGGGGGTHSNNTGGGPGGGYSGGSAPYHGSNYEGGGGGSYNNGTNPVNTQGVQAGNGTVVITPLTSPCVSPVTPVTVTVNPLTAPVANNVTVNCGATATLNASNNLGAINWYSNANGSTLLSSGANFTTPVLNATTTYYVGAGTGACATAINPVTVTITALTAPTAAASAATVNCGQTSVLSAQGGNGNIYTWYSNANGSTQVGTGASFTTPVLSANTTYYVASTIPQGGSQTFNYTGAVQTFTAPVTGAYTLDVYGARGGNITSYYVTSGGLGGRAQGTINLTAGQVINIYVGGQGQDRLGNHPYGSCTLTSGGWNGGGANRSAGNGSPGGGASDIRVGGNALANRVIVAGGGGGCGWTYAAGGAGGGLTGGAGTNHASGGGTQANGGAVGSASGSCGKTAGTLGQGGTGSGSSAGGGGGGGGYYGGGGGGYNQGGGGGSSYIGGVTNGTTTQGVRNGHGQIIITWSGAGCVSPLVPVAISVTPLATPTVSASAAAVNCGQTSVLTAQGGNGSTYTWFANANGTNQVATGASFTTPALSSSTTYYVAATAAPACSSAIVPMAITVNGPAAPVAANAIVNCGNPTTLSAANGGGQVYTWYTDSLATQQVGTGASYTTPTLSTTTTYYVNSGTAMAPAATYTFTNANASGANGPTQAQLNSAYSGTNLAGQVTSSNGIQLWTVPQTGVYTIDARGARGGSYPGRVTGGNGARMVGTFNLTAGQQIKILVGQEGYYGGGGGGSFVATSANVPLIVAGGGGGGGSSCGGNPPHAGTATNGGNNYNACGYGSYNGGSNGSGGSGPGSNGGPGGGFSGNGTPTDANAGRSFLNGGMGGNVGWYGGFGGGGGTGDDQGAGGGGYSGGAGDVEDGNGGAGGSYNSGTNQSNTAAFQAGMGQVIITRMSSPCVSVVTPVTVTVNAIAAPTVAGNTTLCANGVATTTLTASGGGGNSYTWYANANGTGQLGTNAAFTTPGLNNTTTYYVQSATPQGGSQTFNYTGGIQTFTAPVNGTYTLEVWGAQGGGGANCYGQGGAGGYSKGNVTLTAGQVIHIGVGQAGFKSSSSTAYNGGGAGNPNGGDPGYTGGGATHIATTGGVLAGLSGNQNSVLVVAGGGGGAAGGTCVCQYQGNGGAGGGTTGISGTCSGNNCGYRPAGSGGTQNAGGTSQSASIGASFGLGATSSTSTGDCIQGGGGGGGWYGGGAGGHAGGGGGGGSGYVAPALTVTQVTAGNASMPNPAGGIMTGRLGDGIAKITWSGTGCVSSVTPVTVTVNALPAAPSANAASICTGQTATLNASANANWYTVPNGGVSIGQAQTYTTPSLNNTVTYYMEGVNGPCVSATRTPVTVTVNAGPASNAGSSIVDASTCGKNVVNVGGNALAAGQSGQWSVLSATNNGGNPGVFSLAGTSANDQFTGAYGGTYVLQWQITDQANGCIGMDTMVVTFNQPVDAVINGLIGQGDLLWCGLTGTDWSTSTNWYQKQAAGHYVRMSGAVQPSIANEVFTVSIANGGMCIGSNNPSLTTNSYAEDVYVGPGITWNLSNDSINIAQNLVNNGTIIASTGIVNVTGSSNSTVSGSGNTQLFNMRVNKSAGATLTLQQPVLVTNILEMNQGNVFTTSANLLTLGTSSAAPGSLTYNSGTIVGPFKRYFANVATAGTGGLFPVGTAVYNRYADFSFGSGPGVDQFLTVEYKPGAPMQGGIPLYNGLPLMSSGSMIQNYSADGYWSVIPTNNNYTAPITSVNYGVTLFANNLTGMQSPQVCRIIKSAGSNSAAQHHVAWQACGTHTPINGAANPQAFLITSTATQGFSWFNIGTPNSQALPVELLSFNGDCNEGQVNLTWQTATEHNSDYFEVEKSRDGMNWQVLTTVNAAGNSTQLLNYEATDAQGMEGNNYYRLTQVDIDGTTKTYDVINVSCSGTAKGYFSAYPNPSTGSFQVILNDKNLVGSGILSVKDTKGAELLNRTIEVKPGINMFSVTDLNLAPGVYYIQIVNGERATEVLKEVIR